MRIICLRDFQSDVEADPLTICASENGVEVPRGGRTVVVKRKFIVLIGGSTPDQLVLVIGPLVPGYKHQRLLNAEAVPTGMQVSGGGLITFTGSDEIGKVIWKARVHDSSVEYGVYDSAILGRKNEQQLADTIRMEVVFEYQSYALPRRR